jgi:hypothetical protein
MVTHTNCHSNTVFVPDRIGLEGTVQRGISPSRQRGLDEIWPSGGTSGVTLILYKETMEDAENDARHHCWQSRFLP